MAQPGLMQVVTQPPPHLIQGPGDSNIPYETWVKMYDYFKLLGGFEQLDEPIKRAHFVVCLSNERQRVFFDLDVASDSV